MQFGLQARVVAGLTLLTTVLVVVVGWGWLAREEARLDRELEARQTRLAALIEHGMAGPIWNLDRATVSEMLGAIMADPRSTASSCRAWGCRQAGPGAAAPSHRCAPWSGISTSTTSPSARAVKR